jgi:DNA-binding NarL/FixJ family response regulator
MTETEKKKKILIVEDEAVTGMDLWHILDLWGYEMCEQVSTGEKAIQVAEQEKPDIVLIDINLVHGINGIETARHIISRLDTSVIFITGYSDEEIRKETEDVNPAGYFVKPIDHYKLREAIDSVAF